MLKKLYRDGTFDIVVLADILWYITSRKSSNSWWTTSSDHVPDSEILKSVEQMLSKDGEVWIASGKYTTCALDFFALAGNAWNWEPIVLGDTWEMKDVQGVANLDERKQNCLCWKMTRNTT